MYSLKETKEICQLNVMWYPGRILEQKKLNKMMEICIKYRLQ